MNHEISTKNWHTALATILQSASSGDVIIVQSAAQQRLGERAHQRLCPEKQLTFKVKGMEDQSMREYESMKAYLCKNCGRRINAAFYHQYGNCPTLTGCGSTNVRKATPFDDMKPYELAEALANMFQRINELETQVNVLKEMLPIQGKKPQTETVTEAMSGTTGVVW